MAQIVSYPPLDQPITQIVRQRHAWDQFNPSGLVSKAWEYFFRWVQALVNVAPQVIGTVALTTQAASIPATIIATTFPARPNIRLLPGFYRVSYYTRLTQAATTSSELTISIRWVDGGVTITQAGTLLNGNTTSIYQTTSFLVRVDEAQQISYLTTYVSVGGTPMQYRLHITVEAIPEAA